MDREIAAKYTRANFEPGDRLAVVLLNKRTGSVIQRVTTSEKIAAEDFQAWLRHQNAQRFEIYISMNALKEGATGRTKAEIATIRHLYLDLDENGSAAVEALLKRQDVPTPNYLVNSSPDKWQVIWKVAGFDKHQAEELQKTLVAETGADPAATDCARVLRLPGFYSHKYAKPYFVGVESRAEETYGPERFPKISGEPSARSKPLEARDSNRRHGPQISQSERDWAYAKRALARGESPALIATAIENYRRYEKHNPRYYAELTVKKATEALQADRSDDCPERA